MRSAPVRHFYLAVWILAAVSLFVVGFGCSKEPAAPQPVVPGEGENREAAIGRVLEKLVAWDVVRRHDQDGGR